MSQATCPIEAPKIASSAPGYFQNPRVKTIGMILGLFLIVLANFGLRAKLEATPLPHYPVFPNDEVPRTWRLLLPVDMVNDNPAYQNTYHWFTTGLTVVKLLEEVFTPNQVFYALNMALIICSFVVTWFMFRSAIFSFTMAICMAFGTQFHWLYICSSIVCFYLYVIYVEINLLCILKTVQTGERSWKIAYAVSLVVLALCHEQWLDYTAFLTLGSIFGLVYARYLQKRELTPRVWFVLITSWLVTGLYLAIRLCYGGQQYRSGHESEMIFTYSNPILALEDFMSNVLTYIYIAVSNYFPPFMVSSNSLYRLGAERIVAEQRGYHESHTHLTAEHHVFYWYFYAGITFAVFVYYLQRNARTALQQGSSRHVCLFLAMLMVVCGFAIHALVKYRPYLSVPFLTYKCMTSNVGVALLFSGCLMSLRDWLPNWKRLYVVVIVLVWCTIAYGGLARPRYLSHLSAQVGLSPVPDPSRNLRLPRILRKAERSAESRPIQQGNP